jgi:hypothetical protein
MLPVRTIRHSGASPMTWPLLRTLLMTAGLLCAGCASASTATWHVATSGADSNPGTAAQPFRTWQRAVDLAAPGDTILVAPGTYEVSGRQGYGVRITQSGTSSAPITLRGDGGRPTLDCRNVLGDRGMSCLDVRASWWRIADIAVTGAVQRKVDDWVVGIQLDDAAGNVLERFATYGHEGPGILVTGNSPGNQLIDCDAYDNFDRRTQPPGEHADGIQVASIPASATGNRVSGCRAWGNADDGFDLWQAEAPVTIEGSWAFRNGYRPGTTTAAGNGNGFKLGRSSGAPRHRVVRNLAFENRLHGFVSNGASGQLDVANNTSFDNRGKGFSFPERVAFRLRNNVAHRDTNELNGSVQQQANSWQVIGTLSDGDFQSVDSAGADGARAAGGAMPQLAFLRPAAGGRLVNRGVDTGVAYGGNSPDLGAFEAGTTSAPAGGGQAANSPTPQPQTQPAAQPAAAPEPEPDRQVSGLDRRSPYLRFWRRR